MTPDTTDFNSLSKKQLVELVIAKYNDCFRLEEENKKLRDLKCVPSNLKTLIRIDKENERLEEENKKLKEDLEHRDSFFSIMRDVLENEKLKFDFYELREILYCVVHEECGDYDLSEKELEIVKKFWNREYV